MDMQFDRFGEPGNSELWETSSRLGGPPTCARLVGPSTSARIVGPPVIVLNPPPLDWPSLAARLAAAHATRQILAQQLHRRRAASGSFAPAFAACLANAVGTGDSSLSQDVNQELKSDGKSAGAIAHYGEGRDPTKMRG